MRWKRPATSRTRRIRAPRKTDLLALAEAEEYVVQHKNSLELPNHILATDRIDRRPVSYGLIRVTDLFTARQLALFGTAFSWINSTSTTAEVRCASRLALSNALTTNNRLCSYATDYGRLAPLFSVRSYSLPWLAVELNPLHPTGGRGTLARISRRAARSVTSRARRHVWSLEGNKPVAQEFAFPRFTAEPDVRCMSATEPLVDLSPVNVACLTLRISITSRTVSYQSFTARGTGNALFAETPCFLRGPIQPTRSARTSHLFGPRPRRLAP